MTTPATTTYRLDLPWPRPPLRSNDRRGHWAQHAKLVREVRATVAVLAQQAKIPQGSHLTVQLFYAPGRRTKIDSHNLHPTVKASVDALATPSRQLKTPRSVPWIGLRLVEDDTDQHVTILTPQVLYPPEPGPRCWLTVEVAP